MRLVYRVEAQRDLAVIHEYIAIHNPPAAGRVLKRLRLAVGVLREFPRAGHAGAVPGTYELVIPGLPYIAVYCLSPSRVEIIAIFHTSTGRPRAQPKRLDY